MKVRTMSRLDSEILNSLHGIVQLDVILVQVIRSVHHVFRITSIALLNAIFDALMEPTKMEIISNV